MSNQKDWIRLLSNEYNAEIMLDDGFRKILKDELVLKLRLQETPKALKELSKEWLSELKGKADKIIKFCNDNKIPYILTDSSDGIDIHIFTSNLKTIAKEILDDNKNLTRMEVIKMAIEQIILVKSKIVKEFSIEVKNIDDGRVLSIGGRNEVTKAYKTVITAIRNKGFTQKDKVRYPKKIIKWEIPMKFENEVRKNLENIKEHKSTKDYDLATIGDCYDYLDHKKESEVRLINPNKRGDIRQFFIHSKKELFDLVNEWSGKNYNFYICINERKKNGTIGKDVRSVKTIVIDIDAVRVDHYLEESERKKLPASRFELQLADIKADTIIKWEFLKKGFKRPIKTMSGNGFQLWIAIPEIIITDENREEIDGKIQSFNKIIRDKYTDNCVSIDNIGDLARIIKVIGTKSIKGKKDGDFRPHRLSYSTEQMKRKEDKKLREFILNLKPEEMPAPAPKKDIISKKQVTQLNLSQIKTTDNKLHEKLENDPGLKKLLKGDCKGFESKSEAEAKAVAKLLYHGFSKDEIFHILNNSGMEKWVSEKDYYKNRTFYRVANYVYKKAKEEKKKSKKELDFLAEQTENIRFIAMVVSDTSKLDKVTDLVKKNNLITYDGKARPHKVYHITLQIPTYRPEQECKLEIEKNYNFEISAKITGVKKFGVEKVALELSNLKVINGNAPGKDLLKHFTELYEARHPFKPHVTIAEGPAKEITKFFKENKDKIEQLLIGKSLELKSTYICKHLGVNK